MPTRTSWRGLRLLLQLGVTLVLLGALWRLLDSEDLVHRLRTADPRWLVAGLLLTVPVMLLSALRWCYTARQLDAELGFGHALRELYLSLFLNQILPGGLTGDAIRAWRHGRREAARERQRMGPAIRAVVIERMAGYLSLGPVVLAGVALWPSLPGAAPAMQIWAPLAGAVLVIGGLGTALVVFARSGAGGVVDRFFTDVRRALLSRRTLGPQAAYALLLLAGYLAMFYCSAQAAHAPLTLLQLVAIVPAVLLSMAIPLSIAGWGLRETAAVALWAMAGLPAEGALAASILYGLLTLLGSLPGALALLFDR